VQVQVHTAPALEDVDAASNVEDVPATCAHVMRAGGDHHDAAPDKIQKSIYMGEATWMKLDSTSLSLALPLLPNERAANDDGHQVVTASEDEQDASCCLVLFTPFLGPTPAGKRSRDLAHASRMAQVVLSGWGDAHTLRGEQRTRGEMASWHARFEPQGCPAQAPKPSLFGGPVLFSQVHAPAWLEDYEDAAAPASMSGDTTPSASPPVCTDQEDGATRNNARSHTGWKATRKDWVGQAKKSECPAAGATKPHVDSEHVRQKRDPQALHVRGTGGRTRVAEQGGVTGSARANDRADQADQDSAQRIDERAAVSCRVGSEVVAGEHVQRERERERERERALLGTMDLHVDV